MTLIISKGLTLDNGTRAAAIAGVSPTLDYRFAREKREIETVSLTDRLTYTGGNGTFVGSDGFIQRATTNIPRFDHDPLSRRSLGLLSEVERTNLLLRSEEFNVTPWSPGANSSVQANTTASPDSRVSADTWIPNSGVTITGNGNFHSLRTSAITVSNATSYSLSLYVKSAGYSVIRFGLSSQVNLVNNYSDITASLSTLAVTQTLGTGTIADAGNGWYRITATGTTTGTTAYAVAVVADGGTADGTSGLFLWGAQLEVGSVPSTYIPTTTTAVTRTADSAVIDGTGVITGTYTMVEKPAGCAVVSGTNINLQPGFTAERVMVFPVALDAGQITAIRSVM
jgi:hypothetical protein